MRRWLPILLGLLTALPVAAQHDALLRAARMELRSHAAADSLSLRLDRVDAEVTSSEVRVEFAGRELPRGRAHAQVLQRQTDGSWDVVGNATFYLAHFDSLVVLSERVGRDEVIAEGNAQVVLRESTRLRGEMLTPARYRELLASGGAYSRRLLMPDRPLRIRDVRAPFAAETGSRVRMRYARNGILLDLPCKAREPGFAGETIELYSPDTRTTYLARLEGDGQATWVETL